MLRSIVPAALVAALAFATTPTFAHMGQGQGMRQGQGMMMHDCPMGQGMMMGGMGPGSMMMGQGPMMGMGPGPMMGGPGRFVEGRIAFLKAELRITSEQEKPWNAFAEALRESAQSMQGMHSRMMSGDDMPESLPERMQWHETFMADHLERLKTLREAAEPLYAVLTPDQKQKADMLMMGMM